MSSSALLAFGAILMAVPARAWATDPTVAQTVSVDFEGAPMLTSATAAASVIVNTYDTTNHYWKGSTYVVGHGGALSIEGVAASTSNAVLVSMENCNNTFTTCTAPLAATTVTTKNAACTETGVTLANGVSIGATAQSLVTFSDGGQFSCTYDIDATLAHTDAVDHYVKVTFTIQ